MPRRKYGRKGAKGSVKRARNLKRSLVANLRRRGIKRFKRTTRRPKKWSLVRQIGVMSQRPTFTFVNKINDYFINASETVNNFNRCKDLIIYCNTMYHAGGAGTGAVYYDGAAIPSIPFGSDVWFGTGGAQYQFYRVLKCKIEITVKMLASFSHKFSLVTTPDGLVAYTNDNDAMWGSIGDDPQRKWHYCPFSTTHQSKCNLSTTIDMTKLATEQRDDEWSGGYQTFPNRYIAVTLFGRNQRGISDSYPFAEGGNCSVDIKVTQTGYAFGRSLMLGDDPA